MLKNDEDSFPRGGKKITLGIKRKPDSDSLFPQEKPTKKTKKTNNSVDTVDDLNFASLNDTNGSLTVAKVREGMVVLACIKKIGEHSIEVELPGMLNAKITIDCISDPLNIVLKNMVETSKMESTYEMISKMLKIGQYVPFKVRNVFDSNEEKSSIFGSISPTEINFGRRHNSFKKGELLWCAVISESDHGYQLDCGISGCRIFLPIQNWDEKRELKLGQPIWCKIHKVENEQAASTLRVGAKFQHIEEVFTDETLPLNLICPGTKVEVFVEKVLNHGICCRFLEDFVGFIHETHLNDPLQKITSIKEGSTLKAYVLYIEETTKIAHLSLRSLNTKCEPSHSRGEKQTGTILKKCPTGVYLELSKGEKGWISNRRLLNSLKTNSKSLDQIKEKFKPGTKQRCAILCYHHMDRVYICSNEKEILNERYFNYKNFKVGELVEGTVQEIKPNGIVLMVGQVKGFVPNIHLTDSQYSEVLKRKFLIGKKLKARVFSLSEKNVIFTLKSKFIRDGRCLKSLENAEIDQIYPALVLKAKTFGIAMTFYDNIECFVPTKDFDFPVTNEYKLNPSSYYQTGQVINVRITQIKQDKITASLQLDVSKYKLIVGAFVSGVVKSVEKNGLKIIVDKYRAEGFIPVEHLSSDVTLCNPLLKTFKENDEVTNLIVIKSDENGTILSRREGLAFKRCGLSVLKLNKIRKGCLLRCSIESIDKQGIFVSTPIKNFNKEIFVDEKYLCEEKVEYRLQQSICGKVIEINYETEHIVLDMRYKSVFDNNLRNSVGMFTEYLADEEHLRKFGEENGWKLTEYKIGEKVTCLVKESSPRGCLVELPNGFRGLVVKSLCGSCRKGNKVRGIVLGYNYSLEYVHICLDPSIMKHISLEQDGSNEANSTTYTVQKLITKDQYVLGVLRKSKKLIYLPYKMCENDVINSCKPLYENETFKVEICGKFENKLIGFHKKIVRSLDHQHEKKNKPLVKSECVEPPEWTKKDQGTAKVEEMEIHTEECIEDEPTEAISPEDNDSSDDEISENGVSFADSGIHSRYNSDSSKEKSNNTNNEMGEEKEEVEVKQEIEETLCSEDHKSILPPISTFFTTTNARTLESSSDEDDEQKKEADSNRKKKKLTPLEKSELARLEEERITKIEKQLADSAFEPQSADQFERILLAEPNSSALWIKYMSFYLSLAEFEKARNVGRKALENINMTLEDEKFNIWISLLNLENLYGTKESFEKTFQDAVQYNDALKVYMKVMEMLHESGKHNELEEKIKKAKSKFKQEPEIWIQIAKIYYLMSKFEEARNTKNACLKSITNPKLQYNLIVKFAILEFSHGEVDIGVSIFENILDVYPGRVNAWIVYVDQLSARNLISEARNVLDRAIMMKLPLKATRVICHKFRSFEEKYGTEETIERFKEKAKKILQEKVQLTT